MKAMKISEGVYWVGAVDWNLRNFHGYETEKAPLTTHTSFSTKRSPSSTR